MSLVKSTYVQASKLQFQDVTISPATLAAGTLSQRLGPKAFPQRNVKFAGTHGRASSVTLPAPPRATHGSGS